eukprot:sb/3464208/
MLLALLLLGVVGLVGSTTQYRPVASKTVYDAFRGDVTDVKFECSTDRLFFLARHGSRNFGTKAVPRMRTFLEKLNQAVSQGQVTSLPWYNTWTPGTYPANYDLVSEGMYEHYTIGKRYFTALPHLFPLPYTPEGYFLRSTTKTRAVQSGLSFMYGVLNGTGPLGPASTARDHIALSGYLPPAINMTKPDRQLRFMDSCPRYRAYLADEGWKREAQLFEESPDVEGVVKGVSGRLGMELDLNSTKAIYYLCANEMMSPSQTHGSKFCDLLADEDLVVLDFMKDLEKYHKYSYSYPVTYQMSCLLLGHVIETMEDSMDNSPVLMFAHEETVVPLFTLLGLYRDSKPLTHDMPNYKDRIFKTSHIAPFAANIAFVRMNCTAGTRVKILVNEHVVIPPGCDQDAGCSIEDLKEVLKTGAGTCDFDSICGVEEDDDSPFSAIRLALALLITVTLIQSTYIFFHCIKRCPARRMVGENAYSMSGGEPLLDDD